MLPGTVALAGAAHNDESSITLTYVDAATSTTSSLTAPGGIASGDLAIYMDLATWTDPPTAVTPSGFTNFLNIGQGVTGDDVRFMISYKILAGSETTLTGMNGATSNNKCMLVYRPSSAITAVSPLAQASWGQQITAANPSAQTTTMSGKSVPLIFLGISYGQSSTGAFSTESPAFNATHTAGKVRFGRKLYNAEPQNHTIDMNDLGTNALFSGYIQVS